MSEEPTYEYIKGTGWVPSLTKISSRVFGKWRMTIFDRKPEIGEPYFLYVTDIEAFFKEIEADTWFRNKFDMENVDNEFSTWSTYEEKNQQRVPYVGLVTFKVERCD